MKYLILFSLVTLLGCTNKVSSNSVLLSESHAQDMLIQCSRQTPTFEGSWTPPHAELLLLEESLKSSADLPRFDDYQFQYVGIIYKGEKAIYINALDKNLKIKNFGSKVPKWCDGGKAFWGGVYKVKSKSIVDVRYNGSI